ncbi:hypothetical protein MTR_8g466040 [Medicago truncatula]|uniref:Uncharacterized protein n=1 Tax=Medicago truncatula TaxID=3880 RepID=A0A072U1I7_MEDTR|nr:hypothetical protein MTR_8g466040 [Medicago truncatula]
MKVIFIFQNVLEIVIYGIPALENNVTDAQMATHHEHKKKDWKGLFLIHQCVDLNIFEKVIEEETMKGAWDMDLYEMKLEELHTSLEAHELRLKQRNQEKVKQQALQAKERMC